MSKITPNEVRVEAARWLCTNLAMMTNLSFYQDDQESRVYASILSALPLRATSAHPFMAVVLEKGLFTLLYNPAWVLVAPWKELEATIHHEALHILSRDHSRFYRLLQRLSLPPARWKEAAAVWNQTCDAANNDLLAAKHSHMRTGESGFWIFSDTLHLKPAKAEWEYYFERVWNEREALREALIEVLEACASNPCPGPSEEETLEEAAEQIEEKRKQRGEEAEESESEGEEGEGEGEEGEGEGEEGEGEGESGEPEESEGEEGEGEGKSGEPEEGEGDLVQQALTAAQAANPNYRPGTHPELQPSPADSANKARAKAMAEQLLSGDLGDEPDAELPEDFSPGELEEVIKELETAEDRMAEEALTAEKRRAGHLPAHLQSRLNEVVGEEDGAIPWTLLFRQYLQARLVRDNQSTYSAPHRRRYIQYEINDEDEIVPLEFPLPVFPGSVPDYRHVVFFAIDTSGSMSAADVGEALGEISTVMRHHPETVLIVAQCDTNISDVSLLTSPQEVTDYIEEVGRTSNGGTAFDDPFHLVKWLSGRGPMRPYWRLDDPQELLRAAESGIDFVVYHTDGYGDFPEPELNPGCPVMWSVTASRRSDWEGHPFGSVLYRD